jgi:hypothetical protein
MAMASAPASPAYFASSPDPYQNNSLHASSAFFAPSAGQPTAQAPTAFQQQPTNTLDSTAAAILLAANQLNNALAVQRQENVNLRVQLDLCAIRERVKTQTIDELRDQLHKAKQVVQNGAIDPDSKVFIARKHTGDSDSTAKCVIFIYLPFDSSFASSLICSLITPQSVARTRTITEKLPSKYATFSRSA